MLARRAKDAEENESASHGDLHSDCLTHDGYCVSSGGTLVEGGISSKSIRLRTCCRPAKLQGPNTNKYELQLQKRRKQGVCCYWHSEKQNAKNNRYVVLSSKDDPGQELCNCNIQSSVGKSKHESVVRIWHFCLPTATASETIFERYLRNVDRLQSRMPTTETLSHPKSCCC